MRPRGGSERNDAELEVVLLLVAHNKILIPQNINPSREELFSKKWNDNVLTFRNGQRKVKTGEDQDVCWSSPEVVTPDRGTKQRSSTPQFFSRSSFQCT